MGKSADASVAAVARASGDADGGVAEEEVGPTMNTTTTAALPSNDNFFMASTTPHDRRHRQGFSCTSAVATCDRPEAVVANLEELDWLLRSWTPYRLRDDSRLAFQHASGAMDFHPIWKHKELVVHEMATQQFVCAHTPYVTMLSPALREMTARLKTKYGLKSWKVAWEIVRDYGPDLVRYAVLEESKLQLPDFSPNQNGFPP